MTRHLLPALLALAVVPVVGSTPEPNAAADVIWARQGPGVLTGEPTRTASPTESRQLTLSDGSFDVAYRTASRGVEADTDIRMGFDAPPPHISPSELVILRVSGRIVGYSVQANPWFSLRYVVRGNPGGSLVVWDEASKPVAYNIAAAMILKPSDLPRVARIALRSQPGREAPGFSGAHTKDHTVRLRASANPRGGMTIAVQAARQQITWTYALQPKDDASVTASCKAELTTLLDEQRAYYETMERLARLIFQLLEKPDIDQLPDLRIERTADGSGYILRPQSLIRDVAHASKVALDILGLLRKPTRTPVTLLNPRDPGSSIGFLSPQDGIDMIAARFDEVLTREEAMALLAEYDRIKSGWAEQEAIRYQSCMQYRLKSALFAVHGRSTRLADKIAAIVKGRRCGPLVDADHHIWFKLAEVDARYLRVVGDAMGAVPKYRSDYTGCTFGLVLPDTVRID